MTLAESRWCQVLKTVDMRYDDSVRQSPEAQLVIDLLVRPFLTSSSCASHPRKLNGDAADRLKIMEGAEETRRAVCYQLDGKKLFQVLHKHSAPHPQLSSVLHRRGGCALQGHYISN
jgi:hypothetical protein